VANAFCIIPNKILTGNISYVLTRWKDETYLLLLSTRKVLTFHPVECQYAFGHIWAYFLQLSLSIKVLVKSKKYFCKKWR